MMTLWAPFSTAAPAYPRCFHPENKIRIFWWVLGAVPHQRYQMAPKSLEKQPSVCCFFLLVLDYHNQTLSDDFSFLLIHLMSSRNTFLGCQKQYFPVPLNLEATIDCPLNQRSHHYRLEERSQLSLVLVPDPKGTVLHHMNMGPKGHLQVTQQEKFGHQRTDSSRPSCLD
ncbi:hypothetical protein PanWU01x14_041960 [Parasponia andersonii]|uniref:Uncharacterized protein n=1 Tax=Parasponia andersonii TaxID=3476 RepID=A0A2P5DQM0_PARAD|nr:hypothetical protein PanWU01x14_041960 [Parasponia andersonii]